MIFFLSLSVQAALTTFFQDSSCTTPTALYQEIGQCSTQFGNAVSFTCASGSLGSLITYSGGCSSPSTSTTFTTDSCTPITINSRQYYTYTDCAGKFSSSGYRGTSTGTTPSSPVPVAPVVVNQPSTVDPSTNNGGNGMFGGDSSSTSQNSSSSSSLSTTTIVVIIMGSILFLFCIGLGIYFYFANQERKREERPTFDGVQKRQSAIFTLGHDDNGYETDRSSLI